MSRIVVLGAGLFQLAGIAQAVEHGLEVVTVDNVPSNPGHRLSHRSVNMSTTDVQGVCELAKDLAADGVVTFSSDVAVEAVAAASEVLGRDGPRRDVARHLAHKGRFREVQRDRGLPSPAFVRVADGAPFPSLRQFSEHDGVVVKPPDTSGSRGVTVLRDPSPRSLGHAISKARRYSRSGEVVIEGFLPGTEVGGDALLVAGRIHRMFITDKRLDGVMVVGHRYPNAGLTETQIRSVTAAVEACCEATGLRAGPLNFDVMLNGDSAVVIEMSPRTGGNGIPRLVRAVDGLDLEWCAIQLALGEAPDLESREPDAGAGDVAMSHVLMASGSGRIRAMAGPADFADAEPRVREVWLSRSVGDRVEGDERPDPYGYLVLGLHEADQEPSVADLDGHRWIDVEGDSTVGGVAP